MSLLVTADFTFYDLVEFSYLDNSMLVLMTRACTAALFGAGHTHEVCQVAMRRAGQSEL